MPDESLFQEMVTGSHYAAERAKHFLKRFDEGEEACLIHAALELRLALEYIPLERLKGAGKLEGLREEILSDPGWNPSAFMKRLFSAAPETKSPGRILFFLGNKVGFDAKYVPPSQSAGAQAYALSKLLHAPLMFLTDVWTRHGQSVGGKDPMCWTRDDWRNFLGQVLDEIEIRTRSGLTYMSEIRTRVTEINQEEKEAD